MLGVGQKSWRLKVASRAQTPRQGDSTRDFSASYREPSPINTLTDPTYFSHSRTIWAIEPFNQMSKDENPEDAAPSWHWRISSRIVMCAIGLTSKAFLRWCSNCTVTGRDAFVKLLEERQDINGRTKGLLTGMFGFETRGRLAFNISSFEPSFSVRSRSQRHVQCTTLTPIIE
jgi:hypothetical protein